MILKNKRHEKFALAIFKGMTQGDAAKEAGYSPKTAGATASRLLTYVKIAERLQELHGKAASSSIMDVRERQERLSTFGREDIRTAKGALVRHSNVSAMAELSKLGGDYPPAKIELETGIGEALSKLLSGLRGYKDD